MKSIMYHYVRNKSKLFPNYDVLKKKDYINQIKKFSEKGLINSYEELFISSDKFLPTFDDGFKDHIFAAEVLKKYNSIGIFFIPTSPLKNNTMLDVHKTHLILGKVKSLEALNELENYLNKNKISNFFNKNEIVTYKNLQDLIEKILKFKKNDKQRRLIAKNGKIKYLKIFNSTNVASYIISKTFDIKNKSFW